MNKWEKQVQRSLLKDEQRILRILELMYRDVLREVQDRMLVYYNRVIVDPADAAAVYQLRYQQALAQQLSDILEGFEDKNYASIQSYLEDCYTNGYVGAMYDIHRQGIPVVTPIQQENVVRAITTDSKISVPMYTRLGNNIAQLKTAIAAEVTRGIASGTSWHDTAAGISRQGQVSAYNAMRIARTEGHRIACEAQMDGCRDARDAGADVVKQWSAAHDERTREHHRQLDGQLRELDEPFEVAGIRAQYPGSFGRPEEDIHCRCALLQRARWALSEEELALLRSTKAAQALAGIEDFSEFKGKYLELTDDSVENSLTRGSDRGTIEPEGRDDVALENQRYGRNKDTLVNKTYIDSGDYRRKYDNATGNSDVNKALYDCAKEALKHRSGTIFEDMYWIDGDSGEVILGVTDSTLPRGIAYTDRIHKALNGKDNVMTLHTHPSSMPPSIEDFNSCCRNGYKKGFVACHNGRVFWYMSEQLISQKLYDMYIGDYLAEGLSDFEAQWKTLEKLRKNHLIDFGEVLNNG